MRTDVIISLYFFGNPQDTGTLFDRIGPAVWNSLTETDLIKQDPDCPNQCSGSAAFKFLGFPDPD